VEGLRRGLGAPVGRARGGPGRWRGRASEEGVGGDSAGGGGEAMVTVLVRGEARWYVAERLVDVVFNVVAKLARCDARCDLSKHGKTRLHVKRVQAPPIQSVTSSG
jgi:hypothetical protein